MKNTEHIRSHSSCAYPDNADFNTDNLDAGTADQRAVGHIDAARSG